MTDPTPEGEVMVEAVARAICASVGLNPDDDVAYTNSDTLIRSRWLSYKEQARAAIATLRPAIEAEIVAWLRDGTPSQHPYQDAADCIERREHRQQKGRADA